MKSKKILSLVLAMVMVLALAAPAFATDNDANTPKNTTVISGGYEEVDIAVTVTPTVDAVLNPYGLGTSITDSNDTKHNITGQIVSVPAAITNESALNLSVGATVTGEIPLASGVTSTNAMKFATSSVNGEGDDPEAEGYIAPLTTKSAFVKLQVVQAPSTVKGAEDAIADAIITSSIADATWDDASEIIVGTKAVKEDALAVLNAASMDSDGGFSEYAEGSVVLFRLTGDCVVSPKVAWAVTDTFTVTVAFTFTPVAA